VLRLEEPTDGVVTFDGQNLGGKDAAELRRFRRRASMVFQNPTDSFDPKLTIGESVAEPLRSQGVDDAAVRRSVALDLLGRCGLSESAADRYPHELSDGQKQRAALARALVVDPDLLVADEPVSALDMSVQAEILTLLSDLQADLGLSMLVISHDLGVVRELCDRVYVMYLGRIVEDGPTERLLSDPDHPYTRALLDAVAVADPRKAGDREGLPGEIPDASDPPSGCRFHPRCPEVIPPEDVDVDQEVYRAIVDLRTDLAAGDLDPSALRVHVGTEGGGQSDEPAMRRALRETHDVPPELEDPAAERAVAAAVESAVGGDPEAGATRLREAFDSPCVRDDPVSRDRGEHHTVACHLYDADDDGRSDEGLSDSRDSAT
jgi:peptide/nickel transport system ATP-binding protein